MSHFFIRFISRAVRSLVGYDLVNWLDDLEQLLVANSFNHWFWKTNLVFPESGVVEYVDHGGNVPILGEKRAAGRQQRIEIFETRGLKMPDRHRDRQRRLARQNRALYLQTILDKFTDGDVSI